MARLLIDKSVITKFEKIFPKIPKLEKEGLLYVHMVPLRLKLSIFHEICIIPAYQYMAEGGFVEVIPIPFSKPAIKSNFPSFGKLNLSRSLVGLVISMPLLVISDLQVFDLAKAFNT